MATEEIRSKIEDALKNMGCLEIEFPEVSDSQIAVVFNCKEITSFVTDIPGWTYSGIYLDPTKQHQYKIDFRKVT